MKGLVILASLSFPLPVAARFFAKRLAIGEAEGRPVVRARGRALQNRGAPGMCGALASRRQSRLRLHALPMAGRLRHGPAANGEGNDSPLPAREAVLQGAPRARPNGR